MSFSKKKKKKKIENRNENLTATAKEVIEYTAVVVREITSGNNRYYHTKSII